jgi:hypothetical protein
LLNVEPRENDLPTSENNETMIAADKNDHGDPEDDSMMQAEEKYDGATKNIDGLAKPCWPSN